MTDNPIVSFCIPLHNRSDKVIETIQYLLQINDDRFDIVIADSSDIDQKLRESLIPFSEERVKIFEFAPSTPAMVNWKNALDAGDGRFLFHLNDRDSIIGENLPLFLDFLEMHLDYNGGVCRYVAIDKSPVICAESEDALMNVPYFAVHTTGVVINREAYHKMPGVSRVFSEKYGMHPHDLILGRLADAGRLFIYTDEIWKYADHEFYKKNISGIQSLNGKSKFFYPSKRLYELRVFLYELQKRKVSDVIKKQKKEQMIRNHLRLATITYFYYLENDHEAAHYRIECRKYNAIQKFIISHRILNHWSRNLGFTREEKASCKTFLNHELILSIAARYTAKIRNKKFRDFLRMIKNKDDRSNGVVLR